MSGVLLCAMLLCSAAQDPVRVTASLSAERIGVGETTTLRVTVETRGAAPEEIRIPALTRDLEILGSSDYSQTQITIPGGRTRATQREVVIVARSPGVYRIPPVIVRVAGMTYRTSPLDLIVRSGGAAPPTGRTPSSSSLSVSLAPDTVYVGEQVTLFAEAMFAEEMRTRQSRPATFEPPAPTGFWIQDLPDPISVTLRVREGRTVETQTYRRAYFPLAPGMYRFPPARLHYEVRRGFLYAPETRELVSDSAPLIVLPLPQSGRPATYNGAVGRLSLQASLAPSRIGVGEATVLNVEVQGIGNVKALPEPQLPEIEGVEIFPPTQDSRVDVNDDRVGGLKRFRWMIVPSEPGTLLIPPIEYGVFDPELRSYVVLRTDTLRVEVAPVIAGAVNDTALQPLRLQRGGEPLGWVTSRGFVALQIVPLFAMVLAATIRRRRLRPPGPRDEAAELQRQLSDLRSQQPSPALLAELERIARTAAARVAGAQGEPVAALRELKRPAAATELEGLLREIQRLRYAPAEPFDARRLIERVDAFIMLLAPRRAWHGRAMMIGFVMLPVLQAAPREPEDLFFTGVEQYERGEFTDAAATFTRYTDTASLDPAGWYDLGLAAHRAGDEGRAVWAWLRAAQVDPRADDARRNLEAIGAASAYDQVRPFDRLTAGERALIAATGWWILAAGVILMLLRGRGRRIAILGAVLVVTSGALIALDAARPTLITPMMDGTALYAAPTTREAALGELTAGAVARLVEERDDWLRVRTGTGQDAWVERDAVASL